MAYRNVDILEGNIIFPVSINGVVDKSPVSFKTIHLKDKGGIKHINKCEKCGEFPPKEEIGRGFPIFDDVVPLTTEQNEVLKNYYEKNEEVVILGWACDRTLDYRLLTDNTYYVSVNEKTKKPSLNETYKKAYSILCNAMIENQAVGVGRAYFTGREQPIVLRVQRVGDNYTLLITCLHFPEHLKTFTVEPLMDLSEGERQAGSNYLKGKITKTFTDLVSGFKDKYVEIVEAVLKGEPIVLPTTSTKTPTNAVDMFSTPNVVIKKELTTNP
jgi:non-homologous end joining protein Ku